MLSHTVILTTSCIYAFGSYKPLLFNLRNIIGSLVTLPVINAVEQFFAYFQLPIRVWVGI